MTTTLTKNAAAESGGQTKGKGGYLRFREAPYNRPAAYPVGPTPDPRRYRPAAAWVGRLILPRPDERDAVMGAWLEVHHAPEGHADLVGRRVRLRWGDDPETNQRFWGVTQPVRFGKSARKFREKGYVLPERVDRWPLVNPFESLAGAYPDDEMIVRLPEPVAVDMAPGDGGEPVLSVAGEPAQTTGRFYCLARFLGPVAPGGDCWRVAHYNRETGAFDGPEEAVRLPETVPDHHEVRPAVREGLESSPANGDGWYLYGALDAGGAFVVQSLVPRGLMRLHPQETLVGQDAGRDFLHLKTWRKKATPNTFTSTLLCPDGADPQTTLADWKEGDTALVVHLYGKYVKRGEAWRRYAPTWGHFSFGVARVVREPLADELQFDITYHQVYVHGGAGIISGTHHWTRYAGDRQFGFLGTHPIQDVLVRLDSFTEPYPFGGDGLARSPLAELGHELEKMMARYRIADGRGGVRISPSNNCAQDSNQALYAAVKRIGFALETHEAAAERGDGERASRLAALGRDLKRKLLPWGAARADWEWNAATIGSSLSENPARSVWMALKTWHTVLPSVAVRNIVGVFREHGATAWVLRTSLVGGRHGAGGADEPPIEPLVPNV